MPKLHGWIERQNFNYYDALFAASPGAIRERLGNLALGTRLFGVSNVGNESLTNIHITGTLGVDTTSIITNWYARTTVIPSPQFELFSNWAVATLVVGDRPRHQMTLRDLLARSEGLALKPAASPLLQKVSDDGVASHVAMRMFQSLHALTISETEQRWSSLPDQDRLRWLNMAGIARRELAPHPVVIVPVRQNVSVQVNLFGQAKDALIKAIEYTDDQDVDRGSIGWPGLWIHLEGVSTRDHA